MFLLVSSSERIKKDGGNVGARLHRAAIQIVVGAGAVNRAGAQNDFSAEGRDSDAGVPANLGLGDMHGKQ